jgi:tRNA threonylcarbamoyladenosine biosynthesis protein TsaB
MNLLALDTSTEYLSIALSLDGRVVTREWHAQQQHAELALPEIQRLLADTGGTLADLQGIALAIGPGSFTGLRIGCGIAQGLAYGLGLPTVGINTLAALAADCEEDKVLAVLDARMGEFYLAGFEREGALLRETIPTRVCGPDALPTLATPGWIGVGSGFAVAPDRLTEHFGASLVRIDTERFPHARGVLRLAEQQFAAGLAKPAEQLELLYVRDKVALKSSERAKP